MVLAIGAILTGTYADAVGVVAEEWTKLRARERQGNGETDPSQPLLEPFPQLLAAPKTNCHCKRHGLTLFGVPVLKGSWDLVSRVISRL